MVEVATAAFGAGMMLGASRFRVTAMLVILPSFAIALWVYCATSDLGGWLVLQAGLAGGVGFQIGYFFAIVCRVASMASVDAAKPFGASRFG